MFGKTKPKTRQPFAQDLQSTSLRITVIDLDSCMVDEFCTAFRKYDDVQIQQGNLLDVNCDAIVSPANSFGDMGGGIDKAIDDLYGGTAQQAVQQAIRQQYFGELPVGCAVFISPSPKRPAIICAPTMRIPGSIKGSVSPYLAFRAALICARQHEVAHLAVPGMGCGVGRIPFAEVAIQMRAAYDVIVGELWRKITSPALAPFAIPRD